MSLLDDWEGASARGFTDKALATEGIAAGPGTEESTHVLTPGTSLQQDLFSVETVERHIARGRGHVTAVAAASDVVVVVTSRAYLIRYDLSQGLAPVAEMELSKAAGARAMGVWMDPTASHVICAVATASAAEAYYVHKGWQKPRPLSKLRGILLSCVAWDLSNGTESSTGEVLLGTNAGLVFDLSVEASDKRDRGSKKVLDLGDVREPVKGLRQLPLVNRRLLVLLTTPSRLYAFTGTAPLATLFAQYPDPADLVNYVEFPAEGHAVGQLHAWEAPGAHVPERFAWLSEAGIFHGHVDLQRSSIPASELDYLPRRGLLPTPAHSHEAPLALALTQYHHVVLYPSRLVVINRVSEAVVQEVPLTGRAAPPLSGTPAGLLVDDSSSSLFLFSSEGLWELVAHDEARDMWSIFLSRGNYSDAFRQCRNQVQRDRVRSAEAEALMEAGDCVGAAGLWGRMTGGQPPFEEVALRLVDSGTPDALHTLLLTKLQSLPQQDRAQATMVATWLTELYLDQINRALLEEGPDGAPASPSHRDSPTAHEASASATDSHETPLVRALTKRLRDFLAKHVAVLDTRTTISLLASYGRLDDLLHYATLRQDSEAVLELLVQRGEIPQALAVLRQPNLSRELVYKFAPPLMAAAPADTVDAWIAAQPPLESRQLLPALLRWGEVGASAHGRAQALRYVQFCLGRLGSVEPAIHNLAVALYCGEADEGPLLQYLASARDPFGKPLYDAQYALRLARERNCKHASVALFCELSMYEDAVEVALRIDRATAVAVANRPEDDAALQRKLWLAIARHLIHSPTATSENGGPGGSIAQVNDFLRETRGLVKIEDMLPLFPDFVRIDAFKEAICQSLEDYNTHIDHLKAEMADATRIADALRKDVGLLEHRTATVDLANPCARCQRPLANRPPASLGPSGGSIPPFYLFPTGNAFHAICAAAEVAELVAPTQAARIHSLLSRLRQVDTSSEASPRTADRAGEDIHNLQLQLEAEIAAEDPYSGELVVRLINSPFIHQKDHAEVTAWVI
ncbi:hypothetical protein WJX73_010275 [Symbiochloris irregularis]|uniref:Pep3/Vps18 beta-propeller domain-containing protein n=1 Tax=Symbiochloris irregularis TaxID=706552 RepID=A0AAW1NPC3_9CHLO